MNEQVNVLKPFDLTGADPQSFAKTVNCNETAPF